MSDELTMAEVSEEMGRRSLAALAERRASGEIMTFVSNGWVYREYPGQRAERLCRIEDLKASDYPAYPQGVSKNCAD